MFQTYFISSLIAFLLGSIPTAYVILKKLRNLDITKEGSGNVGTLNSYEVSKSKYIGLTVLLIDFLKGLSSILIVKNLILNDFVALSFAFFFVVLGHCFSPWLKFKGGRGLATAAGSVSFFIPIVLFLWIVFWLIIFYIKKDVHWANVAATVSVIFVMLLFPAQINNYTFPQAETNFTLSFAVISVLIVILIKHWTPLKELIKKRNK